MVDFPDWLVKEWRRVGLKAPKPTIRWRRLFSEAPHMLASALRLIATLLAILGILGLLMFGLRQL